LLALVGYGDCTRFQMLAQAPPVIITGRDGLHPTSIITDTVAPKRMQFEFSRGPSNKGWTDYIYSRTNQKLYVLSLEPEFDVRKRIIGINVVLRDIGTPKSDENLLNPPGKWHGLQPYSFMADDLTHGADKAVFGAHRTIDVRSRRLRVEIQIENVRITALPDGVNQIDTLNVSVSVDNLSL
jgi:hypothetical protein